MLVLITLFFSIHPAFSMEYKEAPILKEMVNKGEIPSIEQRLPKKPFIVEKGVITHADQLPDWKPGKFGGTMRFGHTNPGWNPDVFIMLNEHVLMAPGISIKNVRGNVFEDFKIENDNKIFIFYLREGLKWSDGEPVTTEDVRFVFEDIYENEKLTAAYPNKFKSGGDPAGAPAKISYQGKYQFTMEFDRPYGSLISELSIKGWQGYTDVLRPAHHLKQYHPKYTSLEKLKPAMVKMGFKDEWWQYFNTMDCTNWEITKPCSAGYPALWAWLKVKTSDEILEFKRNPYYFKVDNTGQQLPYIDRVISQQVNDTEAVNLKVLAGEIDLLREDTALIKMPLYREAEDKGLIKTHLLDMHVNPTVLFFNFTLQDENDRKVLNNLKFRQALNYAMNREEILENVYFGFGAMPEHLYKGHNPEKAEELLDSIGMTRGANGWRVGPNGKTFEYRFEYGDYAPDIKFVIELLTQHFEAVGIKTTSKMLESTLMNVTGENNERKHSSVLWVHKPLWVSGGWNDHLPSTGGTGYANLWRKWYDSNGKEGEEPPQKMKDLMEITRKRGSYVPYSEEDTKAYNGLMKNLADNLWMLNIVDKVNYVLITNPKMGNVQQSGQAIAADNSGEQMYYK